MKKILVVFIVSALFSVAFTQPKVQSVSIIEPEFKTVTLNSETAVTLYYLYPPVQGTNSNYRTAISETLPTSTDYQAQNLRYNSRGAIVVTVVPEATANEESDSLYAYIQPLFYDKTNATFYVAELDLLYLVFDTPETYTSTSIDYLDWTAANGYAANLGAKILPVSGFAITFKQLSDDVASTVTTLKVGFYNQK